MHKILLFTQFYWEKPKLGPIQRFLASLLLLFVVIKTEAWKVQIQCPFLWSACRWTKWTVFLLTPSLFYYNDEGENHAPEWCGLSGIPIKLKSLAPTSYANSLCEYFVYVRLTPKEPFFITDPWMICRIVIKIFVKHYPLGMSP